MFSRWSCLKVCPVGVKEDNVDVSRAGGVSSYHSVSGVLFCGGRNGANEVLADCIQYNLTSHMVSPTSQQHPGLQPPLAVVQSQPDQGGSRGGGRGDGWDEAVLHGRSGTVHCGDNRPDGREVLEPGSSPPHRHVQVLRRLHRRHHHHHRRSQQ